MLRQQDSHVRAGICCDRNCFAELASKLYHFRRVLRSIDGHCGAIVHSQQDAFVADACANGDIRGCSVTHLERLVASAIKALRKSPSTITPSDGNSKSSASSLKLMQASEMPRLSLMSAQMISSNIRTFVFVGSGPCSRTVNAMVNLTTRLNFSVVSLLLAEQNPDADILWVWRTQLSG